jgi:hypothetical protein
MGVQPADRHDHQSLTSLGVRSPEELLEEVESLSTGVTQCQGDSTAVAVVGS